MVDGVVLFDHERDLQLREEIKSERARLVQKLRKEKKGGAKTRPAFGRTKHDWHCGDLVDMSGLYMEVSEQ